jgi:hypothetical protein
MDDIVPVWRRLFCRQHVGIWPKEPLAIEMDEMVGSFSDPNFGLPRNLTHKGLHYAARLKGRHEDEPRRRFLLPLRSKSANYVGGHAPQHPAFLRRP